MSRVTQLSDNKIRSLKPQDKEYKVPDGNGLYLHVMPTGSKVWRMRYKLDGKASQKSLGKYPDISLKDARSKRDEYKTMVQSGNKPKDTQSDTTFQILKDEYMEHRHDLSEKYKHDIDSLLERDFKSILHKNIDDITVSNLIEHFKDMEKRGIKTATKKAGSLINRIFKYAVTMQYTTNNPMGSIDLSILLKAHKPKNFKHITDKEQFKQLLKSIDNYVGDIYTKTALQLMPYVFLRPANIRGLLWSEIDFENRHIVIPKEKMKMNRDHIVPLTDSTIRILRTVDKGLSEYVFPSPQSTKRQLSDNTLNYGLKRLGFGDSMTSHGFRHTASTLMHENIHIHKVPSDVIEMQLAHVEKNSVKGVYNKALYMEERIRLMQWWSDYIDDLKTTQS
ncbi:tyrosine-type recombinase/integrase [Sulfurovum sp. XTW-4]|uniref:Tyrosine-type recombinase/integrase n=1 Tax=Sulfurovum xiamenensis TaxID=3019066 RepID=A0ABT7QU99_9BACT|nr:tyrosine-type recombinase/integrase [Sulfurovum xiamenensis]MDM5264662.1 tyrosine-type recombinase/integrase [Sulfurovum xiamenensis]